MLHMLTEKGSREEGDGEGKGIPKAVESSGLTLAWLEATAKSCYINQSIRHDLFHCPPLDMLARLFNQCWVRTVGCPTECERQRETRARLRPSWPPTPAPTSASIPVPVAVHVCVWAHISGACGKCRRVNPHLLSTQLSFCLCVCFIFFSSLKGQRVVVFMFWTLLQVSSEWPWLAEQQRPTNVIREWKYNWIKSKTLSELREKPSKFKLCSVRAKLSLQIT